MCINWIECQENVQFIWSQHWLEFALYVVLFVLLFISDWSKENVRNHVKPRNSYVPCEEHFYSNFFTQIDVLVQDLVQNRFKIWLSIKIFYTSFLHTSFLIQLIPWIMSLIQMLLTCINVLTIQVTPQVLLLRLYNREAN